MKAVAAVAAATMGVASAFVQPTSFAGTQLAATRSTSAVTMMAEMSKALPFVQRPAKLDGSMPGDNGFDPLGLTENIDLGYAQAAELKHGRVAMLAVVGVLATQFVHLPDEAYSATNPLEAVGKVPLVSHLQIFGLIAGLEMSSLGKTYDGSGDAWSRLVQDPSGSKSFAQKSAADQAKAKLQEVKNGRLAMVAIIGLLVQSALFGTPLPQ